MKEELLQRLDAIAKALGVAVEHLWETLCLQGFIIGAYGLVALILGVLGFCYVLPRARIAINEEDGGFAIVGCPLGIASFVLLVFGVVNFYYIFNPEYYALKELLHLLRSAF